MTTQQDLKVDVHALVCSIIQAFYEVGEAPRPIDTKIAKARLEGLLIAAARLGLCFTPESLYRDLMVFVHSTADKQGPRPGYNAINNTPRKKYDAHIALALTHKILKG